MSLKWNGDDASEYVYDRALKSIARVAIAITARAKKLLSVPGTASAIIPRRNTYGGETRYVKKRGRIYGAVRSAPGEPPRKQLGWLRQSVGYEIDEQTLSARVGTDLKVGMYLELGTSRGLAPRPWLRRAFEETAARLGLYVGER